MRGSDDRIERAWIRSALALIAVTALPAVPAAVPAQPKSGARHRPRLGRTGLVPGTGHNTFGSGGATQELA
jgi:hypothetical protein